MKNNRLIGTILIGIILVGYILITQNQAKEQAVIKKQQDSIAYVKQQQLNEERARMQASMAQNSATIQQQQTTQDSGVEEVGLIQSLRGTEKFYTMENDKMIVTLSNKGASIVSVQLKDYTTYDGQPLMLFEYPNSNFDLSFFTRQNINTSNHFFTPVDARERIVVSGDGEQTLAMRLYLDETSYIEYLYTMTASSDMVDFDIRFNNVDKYLSPAQNLLTIRWSNDSPRQERGFDYESQYTKFAYKYPNASDIEEAGMGDEKSEEVKTKIEWVAFKQQFFSSIFVAKNSFAEGNISYKTLAPESGYIKHFDANLSIPYSPQTTEYNFSFYFGPNSYTTMKEYDLSFQELIPLGWSLFRWISRFIIIPTFNFLDGFISSYGLIILLLTIFIKLIIFPFTYRSYLSMAKMRLIKPEIDALGEKFPRKEDAMKKQQAMMELYKRAGVNPMGGCLPMLFQFPIIIAMFRFFPASIELRGESFLWAKDLASYDSILELPFTIPFYGDHVSLWAILMAVSMYFTSKINMQQQASSSSQMPGMNFMMLYMMPIMLLVWFNNYSSGLCYYYFLSNIITLIQTMAIRRMVNEDKLRAQMKSNSAKPIKKSGFQKRLEDMQRQQQAQQNNKKR